MTSDEPIGASKLRFDIAALGGLAVSEYDLSPEQAAEVIREQAGWVEDSGTLRALYRGTGSDDADDSG